MTDPSAPRPASADTEIDKERHFGGEGVVVEREIRRIDLSNYDERFEQIADEIWAAATDVGFFQVEQHGIEQARIDEAFERTAEFFDLEATKKARWPLRPGTNAGWEFRTQVRPSTGTQDQKESYQITMPRMEEGDLWPTEEELPGFRSFMTEFQAENRELGMQILRCFAHRLGFPVDFFTERHDPSDPGYQSTLRLLHYLPMSDVPTDDSPTGTGEDYWRAGAHTDYDCLTLLHQRPGHGGLQVCPGQTLLTANGPDGGGPLAWTDVEPLAGVVTCNIGDMLMRWSDDRLPSTLHRVRMPRTDEPQGPRYSLAFFCQADANAVIQGPEKRYAPISAREYLQQRIAANFAG